MPKSWPINAHLQMSKSDIILYLLLKLVPCIAFAKFGTVLENIFYVKMLNFDIGTQI